jgi:hypothetical protein
MLPMMELYRNLERRLRSTGAPACRTQWQNMLWLMAGLYWSSSVYLTHIARKLPIRAQKLSLERRLRRFLDNPAVRVREWYATTAIWLLRSAASGGRIHLVVDSTKVSFSHRLLMVGVAYHRRTLPIAWTWVRSQFAHTTAEQQIALLAYVRGLLPPDVAVSLVGDGEFGTSRLVRQVQQWGWDYALRQAGHTAFKLPLDVKWQRFIHYHLKPGMTVWCGTVLLNKSDMILTGLVLHWALGEAHPWFLATNQISAQATLRLYRRRMWIEEMFGDLKAHGFDLEMSQLRHFLRLSRLTLAVCWLYVWIVSLGEYLHNHRLNRLVDRSDRRDLSIFRLGWDFLERCLALGDPVPLVVLPSFQLVSGS